MAEESLRLNLARAFDPGPDFPHSMLLSRTMAAVMAEAESRRSSARTRIKLPLPRLSMRLLAAMVLVLLAVGLAGAFIAVNRYAHRSVPVIVPHGTASATCTSGLHMITETSGWDGIYSHTSDGGATWSESNGPSLPNETKGGGGGCTIDGAHGWTLVATGTDPLKPDRLVVMITNDGGQSWQQGGYVPASGINSQGTFEFINDNDGWLLVDMGADTRTRTLYTTSDGGYHWVTLMGGGQLDKAAPACAESGMTFASGQRGWLTWDCSQGFSQTPTGGGPVVIVTNDGGRTWAPANLPSQPQGSNYLCSASPPLFVGQSGIMPLTCGGSGGWNAVYRTQDLGRTWQMSQAPFWFQLSNISFVNPALGFAFVNPSGRTTDLYKTTDAGQHWTQVKKDVFDGQQVDRFQFISATTGFASTPTSQGSFWKTTDGGVTWALPGHRVVPGNVGCPAPANLGATPPIPMLMSNPTSGWAVGARRTTDGGNHWVSTGPPPLPYESSGYAEYFLDADHAWVAQTAGSDTACADHIVIFSTSDGGKTWSQSDPIAVPNNPANTIWQGRSFSNAPTYPIDGRTSWLDFVNPQDGWLLVETQGPGMMGTSSEGPLYHTTDGGLQWSALARQLVAQPTCAPSSGISFSNPTTGFSMSCNGAMVVSHDSGATWSPMTVTTTCNCEAGNPVFFDPAHGLASGQALPFAVLRTSDGGSAWTAYQTSSQEEFVAVQFTDQDHGWAVTSPQINKYQLEKTDDGGRSWTVVSTNMPAPTRYGAPGNALLFFSARNGFWATGAALYRTSDGGQTWSQVAL